MCAQGVMTQPLPFFSSVTVMAEPVSLIVVTLLGSSGSRVARMYALFPVTNTCHGA